MQTNIDFSKVVPVKKMAGENKQETASLNEYLDEAIEFLNEFSWHSSIKEASFGLGLGGILAVFLFEVEPADKEADDYVWVVVGDIPPAYITCEHAANPAAALDGYIAAMSLWVEAALAGKSVDGLVPINIPATVEAGEDLQARLEFLAQNVLAQYEADLKA